MTEAVVVRVQRLRASARVPLRQTAGATGYDLHACLEVPLVVGEQPVKVPTGIALAVPEGFDVQSRPRSGLAARGVLSVFGTIDADYRGELFVTMYCLPGCGPFEVHDGDRIAQLVIAQVARAEWVEAGDLGQTGRGAGGHGSTGLR